MKSESQLGCFMSGVRNLLHNMKITISKTFLFSSNVHHSVWSSDLHMDISRHGSCPHVHLAAVGTRLTLACYLPHPPCSITGPQDSEGKNLAWSERTQDKGTCATSTSFFLRQIRALDYQCILVLTGKKWNQWQAKRERDAFGYYTQTVFHILEIYSQHLSL